MHSENLQMQPPSSDASRLPMMIFMCGFGYDLEICRGELLLLKLTRTPLMNRRTKLAPPHTTGIDCKISD